MKRLAAILSTAACLAVTTVAAAQPKFIHTSNNTDITADGNTIIGTILDANVDAQPHTWTRGLGHVLRGVPLLSLDTSLRISGDGMFVSGGIYNGFFPPQNPTFGNYSPTAACCNGSTCTVVAPSSCTGTVMVNGCSPSPCPASTDVNKPGACCSPTGVCTVTIRANCIAPSYWNGNWETCGTNPCKRGHFVQHRMTVATGSWQNGGAFPNIGGLGAAVCDGNTNTPYGISGTGRYITGGGWYGPYGSTSCNMRGFIYDANDSSVRILPMVGTGCQPFSQGERVSTNGNVVMGSDSHESPDPDGPGPMGTLCNARCLTVWERDTVTGNFLASGRTVLDDYGAGGLSNGAMNRAGNVIAMQMTQTQAIVLNIPDGHRNLWKRVKNTISGQWDRVNIGRCADRTAPTVCMRPYAVSDDGNTIVGVAQYGTDCSFFGGFQRPFIWSTTINEGVPIDLNDYLVTLNGGNPFPAVSIGQGISADGNAIIGSVAPLPSNCPPNTGLSGLGQAGILYLNGASIPCEPPRIAGGPYSRQQEEYTIFGIVGNVFASGSYPLMLQWQKETAPGVWTPISDSCSDFNTDPINPWIYEGTTGFQLRINMLAPAAQRDGNYRVQITNACGTATSAPATIGVVAGACCYDQGGVVVCSIELKGRCTGSRVISYFLGGTYLGNNTTCTPTACDAVIGACCYGAGGPNAACALTVAQNCTDGPAFGGYSGTFAGNMTTCGPVACGAVSGACCYSVDNTSNVICTTELSGRCNTNVASGGLAGAYIGNNTTCGPTSCNTVAGACCYAASNTSNVICTIQTETRCTNLPQLPSQSNYFSGLQGIYVGAGSTCLPVDQQCAFVSGACCYSLNDVSSAICTVQIQDKCTRATNNNGLGGTYRGDGTTCGPTSCTTVTGACCYSTFNDPNTILCTIQPQARCTGRYFAGGLMGAYLGAGTTCSPTACASSLGACCYTPAGATCQICVLEPADSPTVNTSNRCTDPVNGGLGGTFAGRNTVCGPTSCGGSAGACCTNGTDCAPSCPSLCASQGGVFQAGATCSPNPCGVVQGACCRGSTCATDTAANCTGFAASYAGNNTVCNTFGGNNTMPCCLADFNHIGGVTVQDIFDFLAAYFGGNGSANINGGAIGVQDIFDYLAVYFAGCA